MKRILSLVLTFAMVFTTFGPSVYATGEGIAEIIDDGAAVLEQVEEAPGEEGTVEETVTEETEDVGEENVTEDAVLGGVEDDSEPYEGYPLFSDGGKLYVEYNVNDTGWMEYDQSSPVEVKRTDFTKLRVTDGTNVYYVESVIPPNDVTGIEEANAYGDTALLKFNSYAQGRSYTFTLSVRDGNGDRDEFGFACKVLDDSVWADGIYYSTDGTTFARANGNSMGIKDGSTLYFYVFKNGERIEVLEASGNEYFTFDFGDSSDDYMNTLIMSGAPSDSVSHVTLYTASLYEGGPKEEWQDLWLYTQETGYRYAYVEAGSFTEYDAETGISVMHGFEFNLVFRDSNNNNIKKDQFNVGEENKAYHLNNGIRITENDDSIHFKVEDYAEEGEHIVDFMVNGQQTKIKIVVGGGGDGTTTAAYTPVFLTGDNNKLDSETPEVFLSGQSSGVGIAFRDTNGNYFDIGGVELLDKDVSNMYYSKLSGTLKDGTEVGYYRLEFDAEMAPGEYTFNFVLDGTTVAAKVNVAEDNSGDSGDSGNTPALGDIYLTYAFGDDEHKPIDRTLAVLPGDVVKVGAATTLNGETVAVDITAVTPKVYDVNSDSFVECEPFDGFTVTSENSVYSFAIGEEANLGDHRYYVDYKIGDVSGYMAVDFTVQAKPTGEITFASLYGPYEGMYADVVTESVLSGPLNLKLAFMVDGEYIDGDHVIFENRDAFEEAGFHVEESGVAALEGGGTADYFLIVPTGNTGYGEYTAVFTVKGVEKTFKITYEKQRTFTWAEMGFSVPVDGQYTALLDNNSEAGDTLSVVIGKDIQYEGFFAFDLQTGVSINTENGAPVSVTFNGAEIAAADPYVQETGGFFVELITHKASGGTMSTISRVEVTGLGGGTQNDGVYYNLNSTGWQKYDGESTLQFEKYDIVQVKVIYNGEELPINTPAFPYEYGEYDGNEPHWDCDWDGVIQTLHFTEQDVNDWVPTRFTMSSNQVEGEVFTFDYFVNDNNKTVEAATGYTISWSVNDVTYQPYEDSIDVEAGSRFYVKMFSPDSSNDMGFVNPEETAIFSQLDDWDKMHINYFAGTKWCIDAGKDGQWDYSDTVNIIYKGKNYGPVTINVVEPGTLGGEGGDEGGSDDVVYNENIALFYSLNDAGKEQFNVDSNLKLAVGESVTVYAQDKTTGEDLPFTWVTGRQLSPDVYYGAINDDGSMTFEVMRISEMMTHYFDLHTDAGIADFYFDVPKDIFEGTVKWRVHGEDEWNVASSGEGMVNFGVINLDVFQILELQFVNKDGSEVRGGFEWYGKKQGHNVTAISVANDIGYYAIENASTALMENGGSHTITVNANGRYYILNYSLNYPAIGGTEEFKGYAMAVTGPEDNLRYTPFDQFGSTAVAGNRFGIQFFDENDAPIDASRVKLVCNNFGGFDINLPTDYDAYNDQWILGPWEVEFNNDAMGGGYTLEFIIDDSYCAFVTFYAVEPESDYIIWVSETGKDGTWERYHRGNSYYADEDAPIYIKLTDKNGNLVPRSEFDGFGGEGCVRYVPESDKVWGRGKVIVDGKCHDEEHMHKVNFYIGDETVRFYVNVGTDPYKFWINWDWNFRVDGPFSIPTNGKVTYDIVEYTSRPGWTADVKLGYVDRENNHNFVAYPEQEGIEVTKDNGVPTQVTFDGEKIAETYNKYLGNGFEYIHLCIEFTDEYGNRCDGTGCDAMMEYVFGGSVEIVKNDGTAVPYTGSEASPLQLKAGETFNIKLKDSDGNYLDHHRVNLFEQYEYDQMGISVRQNPEQLTAMVYNDVQGTYPLQLRIESDDGVEYTTTVWVKFTSPASMSKAPGKQFTGHPTVNGRYVENNSTVYITEDYIFLGAEYEGYGDENGNWYEGDKIEAKNFSLVSVDKNIFRYTKMNADNVFNAFRLISDNFETGEETVVKYIADGQLITLNLVRDIDIDGNSEGIRPFTGNVYVSDSTGNEVLFYSFFDEDGNIDETPYNYSWTNPLRIKSNAYIEFRFEDFRGERMTGPQNVLELHPDFSGIFWENHCYTEWNGEVLRLYVANAPEGKVHTVLNQRYIQGNAHVDISLDLYKEVIDASEAEGDFNGKVYTIAESAKAKEVAYSFADKNVIHLDRDGAYGIRFKEIINGAEMTVANEKVKLATNYDQSMLTYSCREDASGDYIRLEGLGGGESGIYVLDFIVNGKLCQVYVAYDLYNKYGDGNIYGIWEFAKEKDEDDNYIVKGIRYWYNKDEKELHFESIREIPADSDGLVIPKAFFDETTKNIKNNVTLLTIAEGIKGIEGKAAKSLKNLVKLYTRDRGHYYGDGFAPLTLADGEFAGLTKLKEVYMHETNVGAEAFKGCTALTTVEFFDEIEEWNADTPDEVENVPYYIGDNAFSGCTKLSNVYLDGNIVSGVTPFKGCTKLTSFGNGEFGDFSIQYRGSYFDVIRTDENGKQLTESIWYIPANLLSGTSLKTAEIYDINLVETGAFSGCTALATVSFNDWINTIEDSAFSGCSKISTVKYSENLSRWYDNVYVGKDNGKLNNLVVDTDNIYVVAEGHIGATDADSVRYTIYSDRKMIIDGVGAMQDFELVPDENSAWYDDDNVKHYDNYYVNSPYRNYSHFVDEIYIGSGVSHIGDYAFYGFGRAGYVSMTNAGDVWQTIGQYAFAEMSWLFVFDMPMSVHSVDKNVFYNTGRNEGTQIRYAGAAENLQNLISENEEDKLFVTVEHTNYNINSYTGGIEREIAHIRFIDESGLDATAFLPGSIMEVRAYMAEIELDEGMYTYYIPSYFAVNGKKLSATYYSEEDVAPGETPYLSATFVVGSSYPDADMEVYVNYIEKASAEAPTSGKAGKTVNWTYDDGLLIISGTGATYNYDVAFRGGKNPAPWAELPIHTIIVKEGVTELGNATILPGWYGKVELPSTLKKIGNWNFVAVEMEEIVFPENLTSIGTDSFNEACIDRIVFNDKLTTIGGESFQNMFTYTYGEEVNGEFVRNYLDITIPASVTSIGEGAFTGAGYWYNGIEGHTSALRSITVDSANQYYKVENNALLTKDGRTFIALPAAADVGEKYTVPEGVESITFRAFSGITAGIKEIELPSTLKTIGSKAFSNNRMLESIEIPDSVTTLGDQLFGVEPYVDYPYDEWCYALTDVHIGAGVKTLGDNEYFLSCLPVGSLTVSEDNKNFRVENGMFISGKKLAFASAQLEGNVVIPSDVTEINEYAFYGVMGITGVQIPESVTKIGNFAFQECRSLEKIIIPASVKSIGTWALSTNWYGFISEPGDYHLDIYYKGTEANWNKLIKGKNVYGELEYVETPDGEKVYRFNEYKPQVTFGVIANGVAKDITKATTVTAKATRYNEDAFVGTYIPYGTLSEINPIFGSEDNATAIFTNVYSKDESIVRIEPTEVDGQQGYNLWAAGAGTAEVVFESTENTALKYTVKVTVTQMSLNPEITISGGKLNGEGDYIVIPTTKNQTLTPAFTWDAAKWTTGISYKLELDKDYLQANDKNVSDYEELFEELYIPVYDITLPAVAVPTVAANGKVTVTKNTSAALERLTNFGEAVPFKLTATFSKTEKDADGNDVVTDVAESSLTFLYYAQKVSGIELEVSKDGSQTETVASGKTIIMDAYSGDTVRRLTAEAVNSDVALNEFTFTAGASDVFEMTVLKDEDGKDTNEVEIKALNNNSGSIKVTIKSVDGAKTATVTFKTGVALNTVDITSNAVFAAVEDGIEIYTIAQSKSAKNTVNTAPSNATNKAVNWTFEAIYGENPYEGTGITLNTKGELKVTKDVPAGTFIFVTATAADGSGVSDTVVYMVTSLAQAVYLGTDNTPDASSLNEAKAQTIVKADNIGATGTIYAVPYVVTAKDEAGNAAEINYAQAVNPFVTWSVVKGKKNDISKYVTLETTQPTAEDEPASATFTVDGARNGQFIIRAAATDGSGKKADYTVTVETAVYAIEVAAPSNIGVTEEGTWIVNEGATVKPVVTLNNGENTPKTKTYAIKAVKPAAEGAEEVVIGSDTKSATSIKFAKAGDYTMTVTSLGNAEKSATVNVTVLGKKDVLVDTLDAEIAGGVYKLAPGSKAEIVQYLNGVKTTSTGATKEWYVNGATNSGKAAPLSTSSNKTYFTMPKDAAPGTIYKVNVAYKGVLNSYAETEVAFVAVAKPTNLTFGLFEDEHYVQISEMKNHFSPDKPEEIFTVEASNMEDTSGEYTVTSSNNKVLKIDPIDGRTFKVKAVGVGKVNVTVKSVDGSSSTSKVYKNIQVGKVASPVTAVKADGTSFYVNPNAAINVGYSLEATKAPATMTEMEWTTSNAAVATVENLGATEPYKTTGSGSKLVEYYSSKGTIQIVAGEKAGKATITGKALDGSNKTVKITVNVAANSMTETLDINVPAGTANGGVTGQAVLAWGKSIKLNPTYNTGAKNKTLVWTVEAAKGNGEDYAANEERPAISGVTVSGGTVKAAAASKTLVTPYTGWIKVTAAANYEIVGAEKQPANVQYIYVVQPISKISVAQITLSKGKYSTKEVSSISAKAGDEITLTDTPYTFTTTYKTYNANTQAGQRIEQLAWTSSNSAIATVTQDGVVTIKENAKKKGTVTIKAVAQDGSKVSKSVKITIK